MNSNDNINEKNRLNNDCLDIKYLTQDALSMELEKGYREMIDGEGTSVKETFSSIRKKYNL